MLPRQETCNRIFSFPYICLQDGANVYEEILIQTDECMKNYTFPITATILKFDQEIICIS